MPCSDPPQLPTELIELVIDEVSKIPDNPGSSQSLALSTISLVSHLFRHFANRHRFARISFQRRALPSRHIHAFLGLLQSNIWTPQESIAPHIRTVSLSLGVRKKAMALAPHPALADGSITQIIRMVFRSNCEPTSGEYRLILSTHISQRSPLLGPIFSDLERFDWATLPSDFSEAVRGLCLQSRLTTLHLDWITNVPWNLLSSLTVENLVLDQVNFAVAEPIADVLHVAPSLEGLHMMNSWSFVDPIAPFSRAILENIRYFTFHIRGVRDLEVFLETTAFSIRLENLVLHVVEFDLPDSVLMRLADHTAVPCSTSLAISFNVYLNSINPRIPASLRLINVLQHYLTPTHLYLIFRNFKRYCIANSDQCLSHFLQGVRPSFLDTFLDTSPKSLIDLTIQLIAVLNIDPMDNFDLWTFEKQGAERVREHFSGTDGLRGIELKAMVNIVECH